VNLPIGAPSKPLSCESTAQVKPGS